MTRASTRTCQRPFAQTRHRLSQTGPVAVSEYPEPTVSTVKKLYARAFRCAHPECARPLYKQDNETGELILNSRVAHIHARRSGGPRWIAMSSEANRGEANLVLLCIEHSYEIDEVPASFPADLLRSWKQRQIDDYEEVQRGWPLDDVAVGRVLEASSSVTESHHADAVLGAVRTAENLGLAAHDLRNGPAAEARAWQEARSEANRGQSIWDEDGISLTVEPPYVVTREREAALRQALAQANASLLPLAREVKVELAAAHASRPNVRPWCDWVATSVDDVLDASSAWPSPPELDDDDRLTAATNELRQASLALAAVWRGDAAPEPPARPEISRQETDNPLQAHRVLLHQARPFARVDHRPYDPELRRKLAQAAEQAAGLPPVASSLGIDLGVTCSLAAHVAGNASDEEVASLLEEDSQRRPLSVAVLLLSEAERVAKKRGRAQAQQHADSALADLYTSIDWSDFTTWDLADVNGHSALWALSRVASPEQLKGDLANSLMTQPGLVNPMVTFCASWAERHSDDGVHLYRHYREVPPWLPVEAIIAAADAEGLTASLPNVDQYGETKGDDAASLIAQLTWSAAKN